MFGSRSPRGGIASLPGVPARCWPTRVIVPITRVGEQRTMWLYLGDDTSGRALEIGVCVVEDETLLVIHAMDLRAKYRGYYEHGKEGP